MAKHESFDPAAHEYVDHYDQMRGFIRQELVRYHLFEYLPRGRSLEALDFGGGDGRDAFWLAGMDHHVTLIDTSADMLAEAHANATKDEYRSAAQNVDLVHGSLEEVFDYGEFDVILSHGVLMYELEEPQAQLNILAEKLKPGGLFSLLTKGHNAVANIIEDQQELATFEDSGRFINRRGLTAVAYDFRQLYRMMAGAGLEVQDSFGVRVLYDEDHRSLKDIPLHERAGLIQDEIEAGQDPSKKHDGQMLHLIATKPC